MQRTSLFLLPILCMALSFTACDSSATKVAPFHLLKSTLAKVTQPDSSDLAQQALARANNQLAFSLYKTQQTSQKNLANSPYSLFTLLSMLSAGAEGETKNEILATLHLAQERHEDFNALNNTLIRPTKTFSIQSTDALWLQEGFSLKTPFLDTLATQYGAGVYLVDYQKDAVAATNTINRWVSQETKTLIKELLPPLALNTRTKLVLVNTLTLKGDWKQPFPQSRTTFKNFRLLDGSLSQVQTMHQEATFAYYDDNQTQVLSMSYKGSQYALLSIMPKAGTFESFHQSLDVTTFEQMLTSLHPQYLDLYYPRFHFRSQSQLGSALKTLGMVQAFGENANFSRLGGVPLQISSIIQETTINVDENGTTAAAATAISLGTTGAHPNPPTLVKFDQPFIFALYHKPTHSILFLGEVLTPSR